MAKPGISISTITWVRSEEEENLLRRSIQFLADLQIPVFVCDGGSNSQFLDFMESFPHFTIVQQKARGVWEQAKSSLVAAYESGSEFLLYTEPDKLEFFTKFLPGLLAREPVSQAACITLISRSRAALETFPSFQQITETAINKCCEEIIGKPGDYTYGPFLLNSKLVPYLKLVHEDIGWGWRPYMFGISHRLGCKILMVEGDYTCPVEQRQDTPNERIYRMRQLSQNMQGLVLSASINLKLV